MSEFELEGLLGLDASDYVSGVDDASGATDILTESTEDTHDSLFEFDASGAVAGAALAGVGTAAQSVLDQTQELRESLGRTSATLGMTTEETENLATGLSDATFPLSDVSGTLDVLSQAGVRGEEALTETANAADMVADATGSSAEQIASNAIPALRAMGGEAEDLTDEMDTFTFIARETMMSVDDFSQTVTRLGPQIQELGLDVNDTAAFMAALEEKGMDSRTAMREFRQAANDAEGDQAALMESLGLSTEELEMQQTALEAAAGSTESHSEAANDSLTTMDSLRSSFDDIRLQASGMLGPLDAAAPAMQGLGIAAIALSTINFGAVIPSIGGVVAAATPLLPILLPLAGLIAGFGALWHKGWIDPVETVTWLAGAAADGIGWLVGRLGDATDAVMRFYPPIRIAREVWDNNLFGIQDTTEAVIDSITSSIDWLIEKVNSIPGVNIGGGDDVVEEADVDTDSDPADEFEPVSVDDSVPEMDSGGSSSGGSRPSSSSSRPSSSAGGVSASADADDIADAVSDALSGMLLDLGGTLDVEGDVATMRDVEARLRREGRRAQNRGIR